MSIEFDHEGINVKGCTEDGDDISIDKRGGVARLDGWYRYSELQQVLTKMKELQSEVKK